MLRRNPRDPKSCAPVSRRRFDVIRTGSAAALPGEMNRVTTASSARAKLRQIIALIATPFAHEPGKHDAEALATAVVCKIVDVSRMAVCQQSTVQLAQRGTIALPFETRQRFFQAARR